MLLLSQRKLRHLEFFTPVLVFLIFLTTLKGSIRLNMLIGNISTQIIRGFYDVGGYGCLVC